MDVSNAFAVVFSDDGNRHKFCYNADDVLRAVGELESACLTPVVFHRSGGESPRVVNIAPPGFSGIQAGTIHGGVWC